MMATHDFAAHGIVEAEFLSRIVKELSCREVFAEYATWLSDVDPGASAFVRAYSKHAFDGLPIPDPFHQRSRAWHRMLGYSVEKAERSWQQCIRQIPAPARAVVESWLRPIVTIAATECTVADLPLGCSRFLGTPDLPHEFTWPVSANGPLRFQAQIDLHDIHRSVATQFYGLPVDGWLVLFAFDDNGETGIQPGVVDRDDHGNWIQIPDLTHVAYIPATAELVRYSIPVETASWKGADFACTVTFGESIDLPWAGDTEDPRLLDDPVSDWMSNMRGDWFCKLMGYPMHCRTDNTCPGPDWLNLFTLGSNDTTGWSWCDGQHLDVYVHRDGIRNRSFRPFYGYAA